VFGGEDLTYFGGQDGRMEKLVLEVHEHSSIGLGYMHTLLSI